MRTNNKTFADEDTTEDAAREEYRKIADRRVRLGLVLAEVGEKNSITVSEEELTRAVIEQARQYRGQEQQVFEQMRQNPQFLASVRAPLFEEKVVDFLLELAKVTDKPVTRESLYLDDDHDHDHEHGHDHHHHDHDHDHDHDHHHHDHGGATKKGAKKSAGKSKKK
jgi:trigger factor